MHRRNLIRLLGGGLAIPALFGRSPAELHALGRRVHERLARRVHYPYGPLGPLDSHQNQTVVAIAQRILPATDTPGARDARVNEFIAVMLDEWYDDVDRLRFLEGLADVDTRTRAACGRVFVDASTAQQDEILRDLAQEVAALRSARGTADQHFFHRIRYLTLYGYYTSEVGQKQEVRYEMIPGRYDGCVPV